ncbi:MerR family transcriptional regulator [Devosia sp.]|uniref:MerR family transcriptional regulator n=1 Tax=Devosia sp. TaxID=1871048 RepID=UPI001A0CBEEE|nr:MerR family transcriptional regulator [Devosia sp.]MBE0579304.1 MerR family transcriptional regulator [Devosia sp.]
MRIGELAAVSGLSVHTIRYYERIGLMPVASRNGSGHRSYAPQTLAWIEFLGRLKTTGMPISEMLRYAELRERGVDSEAERQALLMMHRKAVRARVAELMECLDVLDAKIAGYGEHPTIKAQQ